MTNIIKKLKSALSPESSLEAMQSAVKIIQQLKLGNLKARADVRTVDESGRFLQLINEMAEELEGVVNKNKLLERSKTAWLQEMAHDIRTPLASIEIAQTTLKESYAKLNDSQKTELIEDSLREVLHVKDLVEDLLFLSLLEDSSYFSAKETIQIGDFFNKIFEGYSERAERNDKTFELSITPSASKANLNVNVPLLTRLSRNCADNSLYYSKTYSKVFCDYDTSKESFLIEFLNDSIPMTEEQLRDFGKKRESRASRRGPNHPSSLGLGSVVITRSAAYLGANLKIQNSGPDANSNTGIRISLTLKAL